MLAALKSKPMLVMGARSIHIDWQREWMKHLQRHDEAALAGPATGSSHQIVTLQPALMIVCHYCNPRHPP